MSDTQLSDSRLEILAKTDGADVQDLVAEVKRLRASVDIWQFSAVNNAARKEAAEARVRELEAFKKDYEDACHTIALMHAATTGKWGDGPRRGIVEDVEDLRKERDAALARVAEIEKAAADAATSPVSSTPEAAMAYDDPKRMSEFLATTARDEHAKLDIAVEALRRISLELPCNEPCGPESRCVHCDASRGGFCAGCTARDALKRLGLEVEE